MDALLTALQGVPTRLELLGYAGVFVVFVVAVVVYWRQRSQWN